MAESSVTSKLNRAGLESVTASWGIAKKVHEGQRYGGDDDLPSMIVHPSEMGLRLIDLGYQEAMTLATSNLHDTMEDNQSKAFHLVSSFASPITIAVEALTYHSLAENDIFIGEAAEPETIRRAKIVRARSTDEGSGTPISHVVKYVDSLCNLEATFRYPKSHGSSEERRRKYELNLLDLGKGLPNPDDIMRYLADSYPDLASQSQLTGDEVKQLVEIYQTTREKALRDWQGNLATRAVSATMFSL